MRFFGSNLGVSQVSDALGILSPQKSSQVLWEEPKFPPNTCGVFSLKTTPPRFFLKFLKQNTKKSDSRGAGTVAWLREDVIL